MANTILERNTWSNDTTLAGPVSAEGKSSALSDRIQAMLQSVDVKVNGDRPWDIQVFNQDLYKRVIAHGALGLGEAYMDGWWDAAQLDQMFFNILRGEMEGRFEYSPDSLSIFLQTLSVRIINHQNKRRAFKVGEHHYNLGNDLYQKMLDKRMVYTCAYWKNAKDLDEAQENKLERVCQKLDLRPGDHVLDIGCGWGSFAKYAAENYGAKVTGITISQEQAEFARAACRGLPVNIMLQDYRDLKGKFDHIVSLGMLEHVGYRNYRTLLEISQRCLRENGLFVLQTIGGNRSVTTFDPWMEKYIFPNAMIPSIQQIGKAIEGLFVLEDLENFTAYYDHTLMAWFENFKNHWPSLERRYGQRFYRMWKYYLLSCAAAFRARKQQLWQIVLSKSGVVGGYTFARR